MERLGVFGGTFDPVHNGHLAAAVNARRAFALDRVLVVLAPNPWQKQGRELAPVQDRLAMLEAAMGDVDGLEISRVELDRPGLTFTADTLEELHRRQPDATLYLIVGTDAAADLHTWERSEVIRELATIIVVSRDDVEAQRPLHGAWQIESLHMPILAISSSDLRRRVLSGEPLDGLMPPAAIRCLRERGLYADRG